jgi:hypothetical protein
LGALQLRTCVLESLGLAAAVRAWVSPAGPQATLGDIPLLRPSADLLVDPPPDIAQDAADGIDPDLRVARVPLDARPHLAEGIERDRGIDHG